MHLHADTVLYSNNLGFHKQEAVICGDRRRGVGVEGEGLDTMGVDELLQYGIDIWEFGIQQ